MGAKNGEWRTYGGDLGNTHYSPLNQINVANFNKLEIAWRFKTDHLGPRPEYNYESTPLMVNGTVYTTAGSRRAVVAMDAGSGELLWMHREEEGPRGAAAPRRLSGRGLSYWSDGREERIIYVTPGYRMIALNAKTGAMIPSFGNNGSVDLKLEDDQEMDLINGEVGLHAAPVVSGNTIVIGAAHLPGGVPKSKKNEKGFVRGFDVRTGKRLWIFHTIPKPGEVGYDTWENDSADYTGNTGVWGQMSIDEESGTLYLPVELPTGDYYGGHRPGNGLFGESIVALDLKTGPAQVALSTGPSRCVGHGIFPCAPILIDINVNGRIVEYARVQPTKQERSCMFSIARRANRSGRSKSVRWSNRRCRWRKIQCDAALARPPPVFDRNGVTPDDLIDFTPELKAGSDEDRLAIRN